ncbi:homoserine kinase [Notoacmeibacter sp. MSK16QG-6]|uniref:homoserine kinase n=1 Tax=Notoacmeibacter sp. MSK16QG-6 TaxID=2957982 RepID=UPI0020A1B941|nr:homoserine kinase [Notoacmeibacter sp. MSK16QG-6]MCP1198218.1 homoserine kinase [Notoacmeibacter sp. MSK16QG-6]
MAVYTDITEGQLRDFLAQYDLGELLSYRGIAEGVENSNFIVHLEGGEFILTLYEKRVNEEELPFFVGLMDHLAGKGFACPQPVQRSDGGVIGHLADRPAAMVTFLEGVWPREPLNIHCEGVGEALARMHVDVADFEGTRRNGLSLSDWRPLFEQVGDKAYAVIEGLAAESRAMLDRLEAEWPHDLPAGVIHADAFPDNVFFLGDRFSGLIDFYFACSDLFAYDVAIVLNAWCFDADHRFDRQKGEALLRGYQSVRRLSDAEKAALPTLCRGAATRFMLTRLYDWIHTPEGATVTKKDPRQPLSWMRYHAQVEDPEAYGLAE